MKLGPVLEGMTAPSFRSVSVTCAAKCGSRVTSEKGPVGTCVAKGDGGHTGMPKPARWSRSAAVLPAASVVVNFSGPGLA